MKRKVILVLIALVAVAAICGYSQVQAVEETRSEQVYSKFMVANLYYDENAYPVPGYLETSVSWTVPQDIEIIGWELIGKASSDFPLLDQCYNEVYAALSLNSIFGLDDNRFAKTNSNNAIEPGLAPVMQNIHVSEMLPTGSAIWVECSHRVYLHLGISVWRLTEHQNVSCHAYAIIYYKKK